MSLNLKILFSIILKPFSLITDAKQYQLYELKMAQNYNYFSHIMKNWIFSSSVKFLILVEYTDFWVL